MAKNRTDAGDGIERADAPPPDEQDGLKARIAELEAENAALKARPAGAPPPEPLPTGPTRRWKGNVKHGVAIVVDAPNEVYAEREYQRVSGLIHTEHKIEVEPVADDTPLGPVKVTS